jgi:hypothetical protein
MGEGLALQAGSKISSHLPAEEETTASWSAMEQAENGKKGTHRAQSEDYQSSVI